MQGLGSTRSVCWIRGGAGMRAGLPLRGGTWLTGTIPESIGELTQLETLDFYGPPRGLGADLRLPGVQCVQGSESSRGVCWMRCGARVRVGPRPRGGTLLTGTIPESIWELTQLQTLNLAGSGTACWGTLYYCPPPGARRARVGR